MNLLNRKRKPKNPCQTCFLRQDLCLCLLIPTLSLKTKVSLVIHHRELKRTSNTGRLAIKSLTNSEMKIRGLKDKPLDLSHLLTENFATLLLYPSEEAEPLTVEYVKKIKKPIQLIVPDGNWRQASKVNTRFTELKNIPRVKISSANTDQLYLRTETTENGMATLQAIAHALGVIEGEVICKQLLDLYQEKLRRTLFARGLLPVQN